MEYDLQWEQAARGAENGPRRRFDVWRLLQRALERLGRRSRAGDGADRVAEDRARFWAEVRQGEREAEANARASQPTPSRAAQPTTP